MDDKRRIAFVFLFIFVLGLCIYVYFGFKDTYFDVEKVIIQNREDNRIVALSCGYWHSVALKSDGSILSCGANWYGQLGNDNVEASEYFKIIEGIKKVKAIACGANHSVALTVNGDVWTWGNSDKGQLGNGSILERKVPTQLVTLQSIKSIVCGEDFTMAIDLGGNVWGWGCNSENQLGVTGKNDVLFPVQIKGLSDVQEISCGPNFVVALKKNGTVWAWGNSEVGQMGNGTEKSSETPIQVKGLPEIIKISCGGSHVLALDKEGSVWSWGSNLNGQLGNIKSKIVTVPVKLGGLDNIVEISAGDSHSMALRKDGTVMAWGGNFYGQLGDGTNKARTEFAKLNTLHGIKSITAGYNYCMAIDEEGVVWAWGENWKGQLGDGTKENRKIPVKCMLNISNESVSGSPSPSLRKQVSVDDYGASTIDGTQNRGNLVTNKNYDKKADKTDVDGDKVNEPLNKASETEVKKSKIPYDTKFDLQWGLNNSGQNIKDIPGIPNVDINILKAWNFTKGSKDVIVGILDSGIDVKHEDLADNIYKNVREVSDNYIDDDCDGYIDDIMGCNFGNSVNMQESNKITDKETNRFHGTLIAGIIAAIENDKGIVGVAPNVRVIPLDFSYNTYGIIKAIDYANSLGIKIINCSIGINSEVPMVKDKISDTDILFICAVGNDGINMMLKPVYPASFGLPNTLGVASINNKGEFDAHSNFGSKADVAAPGVNIATTFPGNRYAYCSGTSYACAYVSGIAALIKSMRPDMGFREIKNVICDNVVISDNLGRKVSTKGRVDAYRCLSSLVGK